MPLIIVPEWLDMSSSESTLLCFQCTSFWHMSQPYAYLYLGTWWCWFLSNFRAIIGTQQPGKCAILPQKQERNRTLQLWKEQRSPEADSVLSVFQTFLLNMRININVQKACRGKAFRYQVLADWEIIPPSPHTRQSNQCSQKSTQMFICATCNRHGPLPKAICCSWLLTLYWARGTGSWADAQTWSHDCLQDMLFHHMTLAAQHARRAKACFGLLLAGLFMESRLFNTTSYKWWHLIHAHTISPYIVAGSKTSFSCTKSPSIAVKSRAEWCAHLSSLEQVC